MEKSEKHYSIKEAAAMIGRSAYTIRRWQKEKLLRVNRNDYGHQYFTDEDIKTMQQIKSLKIENQLSGGAMDE